MTETIFVLPVVPAALGFLVGIVIIVGALKMMKLQSHGWATTASILAMLPCSPVWLLGLPMGIWSLVVLNRRNVKAAFRGQAAASAAGRHSREAGVPPAAGQPAAASNRGLTAILVVLLLVFLCVPASLAALLALGVSVFWVTPRHDGPQQMDSAMPIAETNSDRRVTPAQDFGSHSAAVKFFQFLYDGESEKAFMMLSDSHRETLGMSWEEALTAWKQLLESKPELKRLRELPIGDARESGIFAPNEGLYTYRWRSVPSDATSDAEFRIEVLVTLKRYGREWRIERLQLRQGTLE